MGLLPRYRRTSVNVGDRTGSVTPRARAAPCTKVVLPAPRSPVRTTTSPPVRSEATACASAFVSSGVGDWSSRTAGIRCSVPGCTSEQVELLLDRRGDLAECLLHSLEVL